MISKQYLRIFRHLLFWVFLSFCILPDTIHGQNNVSFSALEGNVVVVNYDLDGKINKKYVVELLLYRAGNRHFMYAPKAVMGDVGKGRFAGNNRKIVWSIDHELESDFKVDPFVDDYFFVVRARRKRSFQAFWLILATGVAGWYTYNELGDRMQNNAN